MYIKFIIVELNFVLKNSRALANEPNTFSLASGR